MLLIAFIRYYILQYEAVHSRSNPDRAVAGWGLVLQLTISNNFDYDYDYGSLRLRLRLAVQRPHDDMWMPLWICSQEKARVSGEIYQRRELSARAALFCGWWECKLD